jgi:hypothetical protein
MSSTGEVFIAEVAPETIEWLKNAIKGSGLIAIEEIVSFDKFTYYISECSDHAQVWWVEISTFTECWNFEVVQYDNDTVSIKEL